MNKARLIGLVSVSETVTIAVINLTNQQIAVIKHFANTTDLSSKIYSTFAGMQVEELYMGFDTQTVGDYNNTVYPLSTFKLGTSDRHSVITTQDLETIKVLGNFLNVKAIKVFDFISMFRALSNDKDMLILQNTPKGVTAVQVNRGEIKDYRRNVSTNSIKSMLQLNHSELDKLFSDRFSTKYGGGLLNFDNLPKEYKIALIPVLFMMHIPECLTIDPKGVLPQPKLTVSRKASPMATPMTEHRETIKRKPSPIIKEEPEFVEEEGKEVVEPTGFNKILSNVCVAAAGVVLGFSICCTTQLAKQNLNLMDSLNNIAVVSSDISDTSSYYNRLVTGITDASVSNSTIISKIGAINSGGTVVDITLDKNDVTVTVLSENDENVSKFKAELAKVVTVNEMTNQGSVTSGETTLNKYGFSCSVM